MNLPVRLPTSALAPRVHDAELIDRLRNGDEGAFTEIVRRYRPRLLAFARRLLSRDIDLAEDVVQEVFMRAHRALRRDDRAVRLEPWLYTLTRNCCLDELSRPRLDSVSLDDAFGDAPLIDLTTSPDVVAERRAGLRRMLDGIATLPTEQRHALVRREVDGASHAEVAAELGISVGATRALVHRARRSLVAHDRMATTDRCGTAQADLAKASRTGRRASHATHRHLVTCASCRAYRARVKALKDALHALHPGAAIVVAAIGIKLAAVAGKLLGLGGGTAAATKTAVGTTGLLAAVGAVAVGGTLVIRAGERSPVAIVSPAVPGGRVAVGTPLPPGTSIVVAQARLTDGRAQVALTCPSGQRVADLLPPDGARVNAGYAKSTTPGATARARILLSGAPGDHRPVGVAVLCRRPEPNGALVKSVSARAAVRSAPVVTVCVRQALLRDGPGGRVIGSVGKAQPLVPLNRYKGWRRFRTQYNETGWLPGRVTCGSSSATPRRTP
jgi:RNA polymerase sigma factor (sigma-70 family)